MSDPFAVLGLQPSPCVDAATLHEAFRRAAALHHPDTAKHPDATAQFFEIQTARETLMDPVENLRAYLQTLPGESPRVPSPSELPEDLVQLFARLSPFRETLVSLQTRIARAQSPLTRALLERERSALCSTLAPLEQELANAWQDRQGRLLSWWNTSPKKDPSPLWKILNDLKFLHKWFTSFGFSIPPRPDSGA